MIRKKLACIAQVGALVVSGWSGEMLARQAWSDEPVEVTAQQAAQGDEPSAATEPATADEPTTSDDTPNSAAPAQDEPANREAPAGNDPKDGTDVGPRDASPGSDAPPELQKVPRIPGDLGPSPDAAPLTPSEVPLSADAIALRDKVRRCLTAYYHDPISVNDHSPWGIMHVLIAYGVDSEIYVGDRKVNAIGWLCHNGACRGQRLMYLENGKLRVRIGPGVQGHPGQFLSMLAQSRVRTDYPIRVEGRDFTVADLIEAEKETCRAKTELTFKLIALSHYLKTDATWKNDLGEEWNIPRLIREELAQPIVGAACGGSHRMTGFSYAVNKRTKVDEPFDGQWGRAKKFVEDYHEYLYKLQNSDGSFSTNWFAGRGDYGEAPRRVETTGHMLEWFVCSLPKEQLDDPRVVKAVDFLAQTMLEGKQQRRKFEVGPRGHGLHGLALYNERRFGDKPGSRDVILAKQPVNETITR